MMGPEWRYGDVALVKNEFGVWNRAIYSVKPGGPVWQYGVADSVSPASADARLLAVIDYADTEAVHRLNNLYYARRSEGEPQIHALADALRAFADPKPKEPTDPKTRVVDRRENIWRLLADGDWVCTSGPDVGEYLVWWQLAADRGPLSIEAAS